MAEKITTQLFVPLNSPRAAIANFLTNSSLENLNFSIENVLGNDGLPLRVGLISKFDNSAIKVLANKPTAVILRLTDSIAKNSNVLRTLHSFTDERIIIYSDTNNPPGDILNDVRLLLSTTKNTLYTSSAKAVLDFTLTGEVEEP
jgi:hypothetical protein